MDRVDLPKSNNNNLQGGTQKSKADFFKVQGQRIVAPSGNSYSIKGINLSNNVYGNWDEKLSPQLQKKNKDPTPYRVYDDLVSLLLPDHADIFLTLFWMEN